MRRFYYSSIALMWALPTIALAQGETDFTYDRVVRILFGLVNILFNIAMVIAVILIIWYAIQMMMSGGNVTKYQQAKKSVIWAIVGVAIIFGINTFLATIESIIIKQSISG